MVLLLDTNIAIYLRDGEGTVLRRLRADVDGTAISLATLIELQGGVYADAATSAGRRQALDRMLQETTVLPLDRSIVDAYTAIVVQVGFSRRKILDRLIAATAIVHGLTLVTINGDDFRDIPRLSLEVWPEPQ